MSIHTVTLYTWKCFIGIQPHASNWRICCKVNFKAKLFLTNFKIFFRVSYIYESLFWRKKNERKIVLERLDFNEDILTSVCFSFWLSQAKTMLHHKRYPVNQNKITLQNSTGILAPCSVADKWVEPDEVVYLVRLEQFQNGLTFLFSLT